MTETTAADQAAHTDPRRAEFTAALRALANFLDANPSLPLPYGTEVSPFLNGTDEEDRAEVDRIAGILDVQPEQTITGHYRVKRRFGAGVAYEATAIPEQEMQDWQALTSYRGAVSP